MKPPFGCDNNFTIESFAEFFNATPMGCRPLEAIIDGAVEDVAA
jgi:hypothetical protein